VTADQAIALARAKYGAMLELPRNTELAQELLRHPDTRLVQRYGTTLDVYGLGWHIRLT
jgi:hypothetical protein